MTKEFNNTDAELARCIKSRLRHEFMQFGGRTEAKIIVRNYLTELCKEIIEEDF